MAETKQQESATRFLRYPEVKAKTGGLSRSTIWRRERAGDFPKHRQLTPNAVGWLEREVDEWIAARQVSGGESSNV